MWSLLERGDKNKRLNINSINIQHTVETPTFASIATMSGGESKVKKEEDALRLTLSLGKTVRSVSFSPDGKRIVSGDDYGRVLLWDAVSGGLLKNLQGDRTWVNSVSFSPDGKRMVSGSFDKTVRVWDAVETFYRASSSSNTQMEDSYPSARQSESFRHRLSESNLLFKTSGCKESHASLRSRERRRRQR